MGVTDICRLTELSRSQVHRILSSLESIGFLRQDESTKKYSLGFRVLELASILQNSISYKDLAIGFMSDLRDETGETVAFHVFDGRDRACLFQVESRCQLRRSYTDIGKKHPLHRGAPGKVILAYLPENKKEQLISEFDLSSKEKIQLKQNIEEILITGFAVSAGEIMKDIVSIAAPLHDSTKENIIGAINITGPKSRIKKKEIDDYSRLLLRTAQKISQKLLSF